MARTRYVGRCESFCGYERENLRLDHIRDSNERGDQRRRAFQSRDRVASHQTPLVIVETVPGACISLFPTRYRSGPLGVNSSVEVGTRFTGPWLLRLATRVAVRTGSFQTCAVRPPRAIGEGRVAGLTWSSILPTSVYGCS